MNTTKNELTSRRDFLKTSAVIGGALAAPAILPGRLWAADNSETLRVGLIGCGGRGTGAAGQALSADKNVSLVAMGDAFEDRLQGSLKTLKADPSFGDKVKVTPEKCFVGLDAYQKVIGSGVDVVLLTTPPGFRPIHLKAAVEAGKHVFCEKPVAVDAPGVRSVLASAEEARKKKLALLSGFCWRYADGEREGYKRVHDGQIGDITALYSNYHTGTIWCHPRQKDWTDMEYQLRNWYYFTWLSGDHIVEQAVHSINKISWAMKDAPPVQAVGLGGRQVRTGEDFGHIYDHFTVIYEFADGVKGFHSSRQMEKCSSEVTDHVMGTKGRLDILTFTSQEIKGEHPWRHGVNKRLMYQTEHDEFFASIRSGQPLNDGLMMANTTLLAILGRMAAYTGQTITWEQAMNSEESLMPPNVSWDAALAVPPVAMPGMTKFV
ncbi:MAG TPA: Gfo/Idh/MocA family oxidoreductase [Verrucomicrobiae bacterium]|jgi:myo-inositol 2-dehydrogenase/D-chiro-inositol 1-dehydrogenase|nr:Gfo/Idh/MocA family oxidoreductase [Verrucomicrobiae bacterium]